MKAYLFIFSYVRCQQGVFVVKRTMRVRRKESITHSVTAIYIILIRFRTVPQLSLNIRFILPQAFIVLRVHDNWPPTRDVSRAGFFWSGSGLIQAWNTYLTSVFAFFVAIKSVIQVTFQHWITISFKRKCGYFTIIITLKFISISHTHF